MPTVMAVSPHADDATIFCGGTLARFAAAGWRVVLVRVTDDRYDSVGLGVEETLARNARELREAAAILGVAEVVELGFETDRLADTPETAIREGIVHALRRYRPHTVLSFDPGDRRDENQDHLRVAAAVAEACWVAAFDKHCPQHLSEGLAPFAPAERWYFARDPAEGAYAVDISEFVPRKIRAVLAHETMLRNIANQYRLQLLAAGRRLPLLDATVEGGALEPLVEPVVRGRARAQAQAAGLPAGRLAERFRRERLDDLDALLGGGDGGGEELPDGA